MLSQNDQDSLALVAWKEARGEKPVAEEAMRAVMHVCLNRAGHPGFAPDLHGVIYGRNQFSSMSVPSDPEFNLQPVAGDPEYSFCLAAVQTIESDPDPTLGARYYENAATATSGWFFRAIVSDTVNHPLTVRIGHQNFYK